MSDEGITLYAQLRIFGGVSAIASKFNVSPAAVSQWAKCVPDKRIQQAREIIAAAQHTSKPDVTPPVALDGVVASVSPEAAFIQQVPPAQVAADGDGPT